MLSVTPLHTRPAFHVVFKLDKTLVSDLPLFAGFGSADLEAILNRAQAVHYPKGKTVFSQDEHAHSFFLLLHGRLRVTQVTPQGEQIVVRFVNPGDLFGIALAIGRTTYPGTATAAVDSLALAWPSAAWPELMTEYPALASNAMRMVGSRLQEAHQRVRELSTEDVERRLAHALLKLANDGGARRDQRIEIDFPLSRQDLAEMTAATLHTVSRIMSAWEAAGLVESGRQRVVIRDETRLQSIASGSQN
jgi:CRP/FNR family transcriptional regulator, nitrogen oxide reductase regulator